MRRGHEFEAELNRLSKYLNARGVHMHKNHAHRTQEGLYLEGEPFDYEVLKDGELHCFDAKECSSETWSLKNAKANQLNNMLICRKNGAQAYFLVWFRKTGEIVRFEAEQVRDALASGRKSLKAGEGRKWEWTELDTSRTSTPS